MVRVLTSQPCHTQEKAQSNGWRQIPDSALNTQWHQPWCASARHRVHEVFCTATRAAVGGLGLWPQTTLSVSPQLLGQVHYTLKKKEIRSLRVRLVFSSVALGRKPRRLHKIEKCPYGWIQREVRQLLHGAVKNAPYWEKPGLTAASLQQAAV